MTSDNIKQRISEICTLFGFVFHGKVCDVDPFSATEFNLFCDGDSLKVYDIEQVMNTPFFDGCALCDIADQINITDW